MPLKTQRSLWKKIAERLRWSSAEIETFLAFCEKKGIENHNAFARMIEEKKNAAKDR